MKTFDTPTGALRLARYPRDPRSQLQAWDAADAHLLDELPPLEGQRVLIINDSFGALACALSAHQPTAWSDDYISQWSTRENLRSNSRLSDTVIFKGSLDALEGLYDVVLVRVTRTLALLEHQLIALKPHLAPGAKVLGAGMVKQVHTSTVGLFERIIGPTRTSRARRKARLIFAEPDGHPAPESPYPVRYTLEWTAFTVVNHANVFSRAKLDIGTRFFLANLPDVAFAEDICDLGCGNGVVGLMAATLNPKAHIHFIDASYMAIGSAQETFEAADLPNDASFTVGDCLSETRPASLDLVLCNPPFHQQQVIGDAIAWRMFSQAQRALRTDGELWVVGNRHLGYHVKLHKIFGNVTEIASNKKFLVWRCRRA